VATLLHSICLRRQIIQPLAMTMAHRRVKRRQQHSQNDCDVSGHEKGPREVGCHATALSSRAFQFFSEIRPISSAGKGENAHFDHSPAKTSCHGSASDVFRLKRRNRIRDSFEGNSRLYRTPVNNVACLDSCYLTIHWRTHEETALGRHLMNCRRMCGLNVFDD